eukprot:5957285-Karenia_brevis.AAC.1
MKLSPNDWTEGPQGLMSLWDMLSMAGFLVEGREEPPPPPSGPVPLDDVDPPTTTFTLMGGQRRANMASPNGE